MLQTWNLKIAHCLMVCTLYDKNIQKLKTFFQYFAIFFFLRKLNNFWFSFWQPIKHWIFWVLKINIFVGSNVVVVKNKEDKIIFSEKYNQNLFLRFDFKWHFIECTVIQRFTWLSRWLQTFYYAPLTRICKNITYFLIFIEKKKSL